MGETTTNYNNPKVTQK